MVKEDLGLDIAFYRRLVLDFCFPNGDERTDYLRGEPEPKAHQPRADRTEKRRLAGA